MIRKCNICDRRWTRRRGYPFASICPGCLPAIRRVGTLRRKHRTTHPDAPPVLGHAERVERYRGIVAAGGRLFE